MYKFGIWRSDALTPSKTVLGRSRQYSYSLLKTLTSTPADLERFETVIRNVRHSSGVCRTTYRSRLDDLDALVQRVLERAFPSDRALELHDLGASDGLLSIDWAERVRAAFPQSRMTASDLILYFTEAVWKSGETYILEPGGKPIQYIRPPFVVSIDIPESPVYPLNVLARALGRRLLRDLSSCCGDVRWDGVPDDRVIRHGGWTFRQIPLVHPVALSCVRSGHFRMIQADAFSPLPGKYDVVRAMNLYQPSVFSPSRIHEGLRVALNSLVDGGILIAGRTIEREGRRNDVSISQKTGGRARVLEHLGRGFEFEDYVTTYQYNPNAMPEKSPLPHPGAKLAVERSNGPAS
ncbi:MAG: hypothetical protein ABSD96_14680 [Candidatus Korobacteraceae bacterium]